MKKLSTLFLLIVFCLLSGCKNTVRQLSFTDAGAIILESIKQEDNICTVSYSIIPVEKFDTSKLSYSVTVTADGCDIDGNVRSYSVSSEIIKIDFTLGGGEQVEVEDVNTEKLKYLNVNFSYTEDISASGTQVITWMPDEPELKKEYFNFRNETDGTLSSCYDCSVERGYICLTSETGLRNRKVRIH